MHTYFVVVENCNFLSACEAISATMKLNGARGQSCNVCVRNAFRTTRTPISSCNSVRNGSFVQPIFICLRNVRGVA